MLSQEQAQKIKQQLFQQIENLPEDKREQAENYIDSLNEQELEEFLIQNNLIQSDNSNNENYKPSKCIFCSIITGDIPSTIIEENDDALAIFEINPISKAHILIVPKIHITKEEELTQKTKELAKIIYEKLTNVFHPKNIIMANANILGHEVINLIPVYKNEDLNSKRSRATPEELEELKKELSKKKLGRGRPKKEILKEKKDEIDEENIEENEEQNTKAIINEMNTWLPVRIP